MRGSIAGSIARARSGRALPGGGVVGVAGEVVGGEADARGEDERGGQGGTAAGGFG